MATAPSLTESALADHAVGPQSESFPVLWLLPPKQRSIVAAYYRFARLADHIADHPQLTAEAKKTLLHKMQSTLHAPHGSPGSGACQVATIALRDRLYERGIPLETAGDLLIAFLGDAQQPARVETWEQLLEYCRFSAAPVGRFLLALNREDHPQAQEASDALCAALQILNHLQGVKGDWQSLNRCYLPLSWLRGTEPLDASTASPVLRETLARTLEGVDTLLAQAAPLPSLIRRRFLAGQSAATLSVACALRRRLAGADVLVVSPRPQRLDWARAGFVTVRRMLQWP